MALPPVLTNIPFLKLFRNDAALRSKPANAEQSSPVDVPVDTVEISDAAKSRFEATRKLSLSEPEVLRAALGEAREALENSGFSLGLNPEFS